MQLAQTLISKEDDSVNYIFTGNFPGVFEARYVRREEKYFAIYLSSQSGCAQSCRMCHLTATKQIETIDATPDNLLMQANHVFNWYDKCPRAEIVHFNFMARGEALNSKEFINNGTRIFRELGYEAIKRNLVPRFLISTIMPRSFSGQVISKVFPLINPEIYYSIYSVKEEFRKKWLPAALPVDMALQMLDEYQRTTKKMPKLHWAFIEGENDSEDDVALLCHRVRRSGLRVDIAIVRYNPYGPEYGQESSIEVIDRNEQIIRDLMPFSKVHKITRVGKDVKASCGMFVEPNLISTQNL